MTVSKELSKVYDPKTFEERIYQDWMDHKCFHASPNPKKKPYTIVIPPPNITGKLHMGHALDETLQDILIRFKRMQGYEALWVPGTDHASIATEAKIVEAMAKEGITKDDLGREGFLKRAWAWKEEYGGTIVKQLQKLGSSCDWDRLRFTLDEGCSKAVNRVFVNLYNKGLIYRGNRMVNWCPHCNTSISDAEVEYETQDGHFWHLLYPVKETGEFLELATTRPETMLGDTAVAINAADPRYTHLHGCHVILPLLNKEIPIVCDDHADMEKGTGVVKITPAHDPNDYEVGKRHDLPIVRVFTYDGHMTGAADKAAADELFASGRAAAGEPEVLDCGKYAGMTTMEARKAILEDLKAGGFLKEVEPLQHEVGTCYRCHTTVEPMVSKQWFVKMEPLAKPAIDAVKKGETKFIPERFDKIYFHWMENIKDWCISRQLWWGHQIPAYYCDSCGHMEVSETPVDTCPKCGKPMRRDEDTLDTWFSSALWPFSTLGWPDKTPELEYFYPTDTLVTGYDIIFFWVARMIFSALEHTGEVPFKQVLIHGLVRDEQGRKMSKSLGNGIDPLQVIDQYGADALRLTLVTGNSPGNDMRYSDDKIKASRNFANKLWNATRYILMNLGDEITKPELPDQLETEDKWVLSKLNTLIREATDNLERFELGMAVQKIHDFIWDILCDWYIEITKPRMAQGGQSALGAQKVLSYVMANSLKLLHPFMPYITEELWQAVPHDSEFIMTASWPAADPALDFTQEEQEFEMVMEVIRGIRNARAEKNIPFSKKAKVYIATSQPEVFAKSTAFLEKLASASEVEVGDSFTLENPVQIVTPHATVYLPLGDLVDLDKERARLAKEKEACEKEIEFISKKLSNENFVSKAPAAVVDQQRQKLEAAKKKLAGVEESLKQLA
ncbi:MAG TPA: valine--tRNA ligase [Candidatus Egerieicola pullicola]|uniref:Valine--tRNA ligase n=1 Tax=Candidatus Egerieicola pullicola TaxID=2840775 RepID=A0A9D1AIJ1_9FIRM|nr:valine--tRNA ligase [Candidatus Egerieicola pullicola]